MDQESFGDTAYCLSCYNRFRNVVKVNIKSIKPIDRSLERIRERIQRLEKSIKEIKKELEEL